jgi:ADP-ribose pyrophosphatase YjhB (NUDIX family)
MTFYSAKIARIVILNKDNVLFCRHRKKNYYFLPGWNVGYGEKAETTLQREIKREMNYFAKKCSHIGAFQSEHEKLSGRKETQYDLIFKVETEEIGSPPADERIEFIWKHQDTLANYDILPKKLKPALINWFENKKVFWAR